MTIAKRKTVVSADDFIGGAPDSRPAATPAAVPAVAPAPAEPAPAARPRTVGNKEVVTVSFTPAVLQQLDAWRARRGLSRAAAMSLAIDKLVGE